MADLHHFYHIYADGEWQEPVEEHLEALRASGLGKEDGFSLNVGLVGNESNITAVRKFLSNQSIRWAEIASSQEGWEQVTLEVLARARVTPWKDSLSMRIPRERPFRVVSTLPGGSA